MISRRSFWRKYYLHQRAVWLVSLLVTVRNAEIYRPVPVFIDAHGRNISIELGQRFGIAN